MKILTKTLFLCALAALVLVSACERQFPTTPGVISQDFYPIIQTANLWNFGTTQRPDAMVPFELVYNSYSPIKEINAYQVVNRIVGTAVTRDTTRFFTAPYQAAYSATKGGDTLIITYRVPTIARPANTTVAVNIVAEIVTQSGLLKRRAFSTVNGFTVPAQ